MNEGTRWDADDRERSHTRAVLMAISRDRAWYFLVSPPAAIAWGVVSFGLLPLLDAARRFDRWRRLEWIQYGEVMGWIAARTHDAEARVLADEATSAAGSPGRQRVARLAAIAGLGILAHAAWRGGVVGLLRAGLLPVWAGGASVAFAVVLAAAWLVLLIEVRRHRAWTDRWLACASVLLEAHQRRPVANGRPGGTSAWSAPATLFALAGPMWLGAQTAALAVQNASVRSTRPARMQLVERMLEWMDDSGLPMEFDVEALSADEIAERMG